MRPIFLPLALLTLLLGGCNTWQTRAEFAPPQSRWNASETSVAGANDPPPPIPAQYCYRTLANVDCFTQTEPNRVSAYTGTYPDPYSLPQWHP